MTNTDCISPSQVLLQYFLAVDLLPQEDVLESRPVPSQPASPSPALLPASGFSR
jgi:hypothetical protein